MKRLSTSLIIIALVFIAQTTFAQRSISDLSGRWESTDGNTGSIEFLDGGKVQGNINGLQVPPTTYTIDFGRSPIWFNVIINSANTVYGLLEFIDDDTVKYQLFLGGHFSYDFTTSDADPILILKKKK